MKPSGGSKSTIDVRGIFAKITKWNGKSPQSEMPLLGTIQWAVMRFTLKRYAIVLEGMEIISNLLLDSRSAQSCLSATTPTLQK
ncbi:MAG: hypothetical protein M1813_009221 [Trichoglossum hirsutum]|nr:MAG: hypothetical protein M1813_009221 [Trichoglossum hirsutum]